MLGWVASVSSGNLSLMRLKRKLPEGKKKDFNLQHFLKKAEQSNPNFNWFFLDKGFLCLALETDKMSNDYLK
ncbi:hypothetical protein GCM10008968_25150 [Bacillus horti]